ncbi:MAG: hypothetical protein WKF96_15315 [Solirubrobacteraceae bacterium]
MRRLATLGALALLPASAVAQPSTAAPRCQEDAPCWTWSTMANRHRGVVLSDGRRVVVGPCGFARAAARIDWQRTPHMRGDATARRGGCA